MNGVNSLRAALVITVEVSQDIRKYIPFEVTNRLNLDK